MGLLAARVALVGVGLTISALVAVPAHAADEIPAVKELGALGGCCSSAAAINNLGQVAGTAFTSDKKSHGVIWQDGGVTDVAERLVPTAINNQGDIAGHVVDGTTGRSRAVVVKGGRLTYLDTSRANSYAMAINDLGDVVGQMQPPGERSYAFRWHEGVMTVLPDLPGSSNNWPRGINNKGEIVGQVNASDERDQAVVWRGGVVSALGSSQFGRVGQARAINDRGDILASSGGHQLVRRDGVFTDLGWPANGVGTAMNSRGDVVGFVSTGNMVSDVRALLWRDGNLIDLGDGIATAINDHGRVAGYYYKKSAADLNEMAVTWG